MWVRLAASCIALAITACVDPLTAKPVNSPEWYEKNVRGYVETAAGLPPDTALGWDLVIADNVATWRECATVEACGQRGHSRAAKDLVAVEHVGQTSVEGSQVDVLKLSIAAAPRYLVPSK